jgi:hypothetical protein
MPSTISAGTTAGTAIAVAGDTTGNLAFQTNGTTTAMTIDTSQNVGIGTTSPVANRKLTIGNTGQVAAMRINAPTGYDSFIEFTENSSLTASQYWQINKTPTTHGLQFWNGSEQARITSAGLFQFNSGYGSSATAYGCRAWVNFNGTGTPAIRASGNVSSITDNGTGDYTVNFTNAMPDANYSAVCVNGVLDGGTTKSIASINRDNGNGAEVAPTTTAVRITSGAFNNSDLDVKYFNVAIFR